MIAPRNQHPHPGACPDFLGDDAVAAVKEIAGRLVVPRRVDRASVLLLDSTELAVTIGGVVNVIASSCFRG